jgi:hypothetical protein
MNSSDVERTIKDIGDAVFRLVDAELEFFRRIADSLPAVNLRRPGSCCDVPPPCWAPKSLGRRVSHVCSGGTAMVEITIENCDFTQRTFQVEARGSAAGQTTVSPSGITLGPQESGTVNATMNVADEGCDAEHEVQIWVLGCSDHYLQWVVRTNSKAAESCQEVRVRDCPDYYHHWYDHFYCMHPCYGGGKQRG